MVQVIEPGLFYQERKKISFWFALTVSILRGLFTAVVWTTRTAFRYPVQSVILSVSVYLWLRWGWTGVTIAWLLTVAVAAWVLAAWWWLSPVTFVRQVTMPLLGTWRWHTVYRSRWREAMAGCGLQTVWEGVEQVPQIGRVLSTRDRDMMSVQLLPGQTPDKFAGIGEALQHIYRCFRVDITSEQSGWVLVTFLRADPLAVPVTTRHPALAAAVEDAHDLTGSSEVVEARVAQLLEAVPVGVTEAGHVARLKVRGAHLLVAGTTGSGKSGLLWALMWALAPSVRAGLVEVFALDPKRMELVALADGPHPLGVVVKDADVMAAFLEAQVRDLDTRCTDLEGHTRTHTPTIRQPHRLIVVDELASITALADKRDRERIEAALGHLESRGRAAGFSVVVTTVEPTKDVVRWRALHAVRVGFRMEETSHTDMVLGEGTRDRGAVCDHINPDTPGVAFLKVDGKRDPVRFRTVEITDADLHVLTHGLPAAAPAADEEATGETTTHVRVDVLDTHPAPRPELGEGPA
ncbi:FtsK/SpoIIIE domain-containing protein [Kineosporia sp. A_224]|uniref:FtsK/SpoIIIE domain-containing protein n=1 Tax=Kineosporia sp. A_224 TaxID=1962180 RepID=UPI001E60130A|nr:FtsK/SpoIIIE domain-containing protein [Kineosporia sp. A_224]